MKEIIKIVKIIDLPLKIQKELNVFEGLVEITIKTIGKFSDEFEKTIKEEGFVNLKI